jgi:hypothetical protein
MNNETPNTYITSDTAEASFLMAYDIKFIKTIEYANDPKKSIVLEDDGRINDLLLIWGDNVNKCRERIFFLKNKWLLKQVAPKNGNGNGNNNL